MEVVCRDEVSKAEQALSSGFSAEACPTHQARVTGQLTLNSGPQGGASRRCGRLADALAGPPDWRSLPGIAYHLESSGDTSDSAAATTLGPISAPIPLLSAKRCQTVSQPPEPLVRRSTAVSSPAQRSHSTGQGNQRFPLAAGISPEDGNRNLFRITVDVAAGQLLDQSFEQGAGRRHGGLN